MIGCNGGGGGGEDDRGSGRGRLGGMGSGMVYFAHTHQMAIPSTERVTYRGDH